MAENGTAIPEKYHIELPGSHGGKVSVEITPYEYKGGIILDSMEEVEKALRIYNGEMDGNAISGSRSTSEELLYKPYDNLPEHTKIVGNGFMYLIEEKRRNERDFVGDMLNEINESLAAGKSYREFFKHEAIGSNFMDTRVWVRKSDGKFVSSISALGMGDEPEKELARYLGKPLALARLGLKIDGIDRSSLKTLFSNAPISREDAKKLTDYHGKSRVRQMALEGYGQEKIIMTIDLRDISFNKAGLVLSYGDIYSESTAPVVDPNKMENLRGARAHLIRRFQSAGEDKSYPYFWTSVFTK